VSLAVAIDGIASPIGHDLLSQLDVDPEIEAVLGLDAVLPRELPEKVRGEAGPLDESLGTRFAEAGISLAAYLSPDVCGRATPLDGAAGKEIERLERFLAAAAEAPVRSIVVASGSFIYGAGTAGAGPIGEGAPLRALGFPPAKADLGRESLVATFARANPSIAIAIARLAPVVGGASEGAAPRFLSAKRIVGLAGFDPLFQFLHVEDAALALFRLMKARAVGRYNVAPDDAVSLVSVARTLKKTVARYRPSVAAAIAGAGRALGLRGPAGLGPSLLPLLKNPVVLSNRKIKRDLGYNFKYSSEGAILEYGNKG
jgi:UDP-glucose 4-epimerase